MMFFPLVFCGWNIKVSSCNSATVALSRAVSLAEYVNDRMATTQIIVKVPNIVNNTFNHFFTQYAPYNLMIIDYNIIKSSLNLFLQRLSELCF